MIPNSSLDKTCASKTTTIKFNGLLICLADHGSFKPNDPLVTLYMWHTGYFWYFYMRVPADVHALGH